MNSKMIWVMFRDWLRVLHNRGRLSGYFAGFSSHTHDVAAAHIGVLDLKAMSRFLPFSLLPEAAHHFPDIENHWTSLLVGSNQQLVLQLPLP